MSTITREMKDRKDMKDKEPKRRRPTKPDVRSASPTPGPTEIKKVKLVETKRAPLPDPVNMFYQEEKEVLHRSLEEDLKIHKKATDEVRNAMNDINMIRSKSSVDMDQLEENRIHGTLQFVTLKKLNRIAHMRCKKERDETNEAKQKIDQRHLQLQNLLYEVMHLQKEITKCLEFKSKDEDINLVPVEEFYEDAPVEISKPEFTKRDTHKQTLARLDWELEQRKRLSEKLTKTQTAKKHIEEDIKKKREYLDSLEPKLANTLASTKEVQEYLGMPFDERREQHRTARHLPRPLFVLYMQATAYHDACDKNIEVKIDGDVDVARAMDTASSDVEEESDSDQEEQEKQSAKRRRRCSSDRQVQKKQKILKKHPLSISVVIGTEGGFSVTLIFHYITALNIVTVTVHLNVKTDVSSVSGGDLLAADEVLNSLFPGDDGTSSPNPANQFILNKLGMGEFSQLIPELGRPYLWVQSLCGLDFVTLVGAGPDSWLESGGSAGRGGLKAQADLSASRMEQTIYGIRDRIAARVALQRQLASLEHLTIPVSSDDMDLFPAKITSRLREWKRGTYEDFCALPYTKEVLNAGLATEADLYFCGIMERGSAKMTLHVVLSPDYPATAPVFAVSINWRTQRTHINDQHVRDLEAEVNIFYEELMASTKSRDQLLTNQLQRLATCFDIYLESEAENASVEGPVEFAKEKIFPRKARGPQRSRPYKYNARLGFFSQR